jgi:hypothetical protein
MPLKSESLNSTLVYCSNNYLLRASPAVSSMWTLQKYFSHPSLVICCFAIPPMKLKLGQQKGRGLLIGNHLDKSSWWTNQKHWAAVKSYLLCSFVQVQRVVAVPFTRHYKVYNYAEPKPFSWTKTSQILTFLHLILLFRIAYWIPLEML